MKINRTKNAARNMVMGFINKIIVLLLPFLVRTASKLYGFVGR